MIIADDLLSSTILTLDSDQPFLTTEKIRIKRKKAGKYFFSNFMNIGRKWFTFAGVKAYRYIQQLLP